MEPEGGAPAGWLDPIKSDTIEIEQNNGVLYTSASIVEIRQLLAHEGPDRKLAMDQEVFPCLSLTAGFADIVRPGARVRHQLGGDTPMVEYNVAEWVENGGFQGTIPDDSLLLARGEDVQVEVHFNGGPGLFDIESMVQRVIEG